MAETRRLTVAGRVLQGVGYRAWTVGVARELGLDGWVRNRRDGAVEIAARGAPAALDALERRCHDGPPFARVDAVTVTDVDDDPTLGPGFVQTATA
jgi:acylphosphatase